MKNRILEMFFFGVVPAIGFCILVPLAFAWRARAIQKEWDYYE